MHSSKASGPSKLLLDYCRNCRYCTEGN